MVEYGEIEYAPGIFDPPVVQWDLSNPATMWSFSTLPNPDVDNKTGSVFAGQVVGGSSAVNGMFFDRGSQHDFDAWAHAGSPEFDKSEHKWNWNGMFPYFKKVRYFCLPF